MFPELVELVMRMKELVISVMMVDGGFINKGEGVGGICNKGRRVGE